jgi:hypothetical protein
MKKHLLFLLSTVFFLPLLSQNKTEVQQPALSPLTKKFLRDLSASKKGGKAPSGYLYKKGSDGKLYVSALIKVADPTLVQQKLNAIGAHF